MADARPQATGRGADRDAAARDGIAVVGMSALFPGAGDLAAYWNNIVGGVDAISELPPGRWDEEFYHPEAAVPSPPGTRTATADRIYARRGGFVNDGATFDPTEFGIMPLAVDAAEPDQLLALRLAAEAIADSGGAESLGDLARVGVVLGRGGYQTAGQARLDQRVKTARQVAVTLREVLPDLPADAVERVHDAFVARLGPERPESAIGLVPNLAASRIANRLDLRGPAYTVDAACASSLIAVESALRELRSGRVDAMVVGGVHIAHEPIFWSIFSMLRALSPSQRIRPFHRDADGVLIGEGVGMVVLKRFADADRAGDRIYAVIRGAGTASDGRAASLMSPAPAGQMLAIERAWQDAGLDPAAAGSVGLIEAHGTATPAGDAAELTTLSRIFGPAAPGAPMIGIGSVKSMIGHAMPAAGAAGLIKAVLALHHRTLPPTLHCDDPHPAFAGSRFTPVLTAAQWLEQPGAPRRAGVNAFGFGGINAHLVVEEAPTAVGAVSPLGGRSSSRAFAAAAAGSGTAELGPDPTAEAVLLLAASSPAELAAALAVPDAELLDRDDAANAPTGGPYRLAIVAPNPRRLALARGIVTRGTAWRGRNDLWFTGDPLLSADPGRDAAGAGPAPAGAAPPAAARAGRIAFLFCGLEDKFAPRLDDVCAHFGLPQPAVTTVGGLGWHGVASIAVGRVLDAALRRLEITPDLVAGHSIGEWNAMISAGMVRDDVVDAFIGGFDPASMVVPGVYFGALGCGVDVAATAIDGLPEIVISHDNCPHQSIICGREDSVTTALARLRAKGVLGQVLPFQSGFHSPFMAPYLDEMRSSFGATPLSTPTVPVWSATTVAPYPADRDEIRELSMRHLVEPVRFRQLTERLHDDGVRVFVQVGVGSLAGFVDDTLPGDDHLSIVTNTPKRAGLEQLRRAAVALWVEGAAPRLDLLPCRRRPEPSAVATAAPATATLAAAAGGRRRPGRSMLLGLGAPLVRLGPDAATLLHPAGSDSAAARTAGNGTNGVLPPARTGAAAATDPARPASGPAPTSPTSPTSPASPASVPSRSPARTPAPRAAASAAAAAASPGLTGGLPAGLVAPRPGDHPVLAEFGLALAETAAVLSDVRSRWADGRLAGPGAVAGAGVVTGTGAPRTPLAGTTGRVGTPSRPAPAAPPSVAHAPAAPPGRAPGLGGVPGSNGRPTSNGAAGTGLPANGSHPNGRSANGASAGAGGAGGRAVEAARAGAATMGPGAGASPLVVRRTLSLASMPAIIDHCFYQQPPGWNDLSDRFPVVPMTAVLAMMIDAARPLAPGRIPIAVRDVRALRWLVIEPPVEVTITCTELPDGAIRVVVDGYARVTVVFAASMPAPPPSPAGVNSAEAAPPDEPLPGEPVGVRYSDDLYTDRLLFHGPGYQGLVRVQALAPMGARGDLVVTDAPGALLDAVGQLYGYWAMDTLDVDALMLPQAVSEIRFYGPDPVPGQRLRCVVVIRDVSAKTVTADISVRHPDGRLWAHIIGWTDRRFTSTPWLWPAMRHPECNPVAHATADGWVAVPCYWQDMASRELVVRHFLDADRRLELTAKNPRAAREFLLGRIAGIDAVRQWLWSRGAGLVWGVEIGIGNEPSGRPVVTAIPDRPGIPVGPLPGISIAHKVDLAVAIVSGDGPVGIDVETIAVRAPGAAQAALTTLELALLDDVAGADEIERALWFTRLWTAKEAVSKADGTGLQGRPRRFVVDRVLPAPRAGATIEEQPTDPSGGENVAAIGMTVPPLFLRVTVRDRAAGQPALVGEAATDEGPAGVSHRRWVAVRTIDDLGRRRPERTDMTTARVGDHVVAWTSQAIDTAAEARLAELDKNTHQKGRRRT
jgi:acyl transferase domain-containing protein/phosphopantetheinyl transferase